MAVKFTSADPVASVDLPSPSIGSTGDVNLNQSLHRSVAGDVFTFQHGPPRFQQDLTFDGLSEEEHANMIAFFRAIGWQAREFLYEFTDPRDSQAKSFTVRLLGQPKNKRTSINNNNVTLRLESDVEFNYENAA